MLLLLMEIKIYGMTMDMKLQGKNKIIVGFLKVK
jgi:hypothetical protein